MGYDPMKKNLRDLPLKERIALAEHDAKNGKRVLDIHDPCEVPPDYIEAARHVNPSYGAELAEAKEALCAFGYPSYCTDLCTSAKIKIYANQMEVREKNIKNELKIPY